MRIGIDVVPIKIDGSVGGAMNFVIELLNGLGEEGSNEYVLLTAGWNHDYFYNKYRNYGVICYKVLESSSLEEPKYLVKLFKRIFIKLQRKIPYLSKVKYFFTQGEKSAKEIKDLQLDLLFCPMSAPTFSSNGVPTVSIIYDLQHEYYPFYFTNEEIEHRNNYYQDICSKVDATICISEYTRDTFIEKYNFPKENTYVVYIAIQDRIDSEKANLEVIKRYGLENIEYALYPANFWPHKNHRMLLAAFSKYIRNYNNNTLHLVFTGYSFEEEALLKSATEKMKISDRVHFLGYIAEVDYISVIFYCKFLVFPSLFEGFGIPVAEALSLYKPVICSKGTSLPEVGGCIATYFDPKSIDSIEEALYEENKGKYEHEPQVDDIEKHLLKFSRNQMVENYLSVFKKVINKPIRTGKIWGIYSDNWTEEKIGIQIPQGSEKERIELEFFAPPFLPHKKASILLRVNNEIKRNETIKKGENKTFIIKTVKDKKYEIEIKPTFHPKSIGLEDERELGLMLNSIKIL